MRKRRGKVDFNLFFFLFLHMFGVGSDTPVWEALPSDVFAPCWVKRHNISCSIRSWLDHGIGNSTSTCGLAIAPPCVAIIVKTG